MSYLVRCLLAVLLALVGFAASCSSPGEQAELQEADPETVRPSAGPTPTAPIQPAPPDAELERVLLLPDPNRWVVVEDWSVRQGGGPASVEEFEGLQLDLAPIVDGVPQLGERIALVYQLGDASEFDRHWGDASSLGDVTELEFAEGVGRAVRSEAGFGMAQIWRNGTLVLLQGQDPLDQLVDLAASFVEVDEQTWLAARDAAPDQRLVAVEAVMDTVNVPDAVGVPLPHWVLPEPWAPEWVTDKTIWTAEQQAQAAGLAEASRPPQQGPARESEFWQFGYRDTPGAARAAFVPDISLFVSVYEESPGGFHPTNYDKITALGLDGVISGAPGSVSVELGLGEVRIFVDSSTLSREEVIAFLESIRFATDDPLDGVDVADPRFQLINVPQWEDRPPSWHASWRHPDGGQAATSVWRLSISELRTWLVGRGRGLAVPDDIWAQIAERGTINYGFGTTYDVEDQLLISLRGIERDELVPIELDDWIELVEPVNTDPLNPR